jgi:hypothetical protein
MDQADKERHEINDGRLERQILQADALSYAGDVRWSCLFK